VWLHMSQSTTEALDELHKVAHLKGKPQSICKIV
jgi:hypothetical protein